MRRWPVFVAVLLFTLAARAEMLSYELGVEHEVNPRQSYSFGFGSSSLSSGGTMHELMLERKTKFYEFGANSDLSYLLGIGYMLWNDSGGPELKTGLEWNWRANNWLGLFSRIQLHVAYQVLITQIDLGAYTGQQWSNRFRFNVFFSAFFVKGLGQGVRDVFGVTPIPTLEVVYRF